MQRFVVFDLDGTLVDSLPGIAEGVNRALASLGLPVHEPEAVRGMIGRGAANLCAAAIGYADASLAPPDELKAVHAAFGREYAHCWQGSRTTPYPGINSLLHALAAAGARMAVLSNKPHEVTLPMVQTLFPELPFDPILGFSGRYPRKPDPTALRAIAEQWGVDVRELVMVGDSRYDALTAQQAPCGLLLFDWGYGGGDVSAWADCVVSSAEEALHRLLGSDEG
ncbi:MAG TPA: HAD-IA family hydrolase [Candidatus Akkermansia intestinigallinarum]|uniref:phosphoglycolate phosphatase n=1 Tax=Candidatus Akkermansia intestinigallinarum TaxID=2838431 RepID=A0A9D1V9H5_9BACT|nr:HAD-IA family hydrolase [Candidatus Akkermansia intestinigallinarum]